MNCDSGRDGLHNVRDNSPLGGGEFNTTWAWEWVMGERGVRGGKLPWYWGEFCIFFDFIALHSETVKTQTWQLYSPPTTGRKWLMAFDGFCASTKCSVNVSTAAPKRPEGFTGASRSAVFSESFNLVRASYRRRSSTTRFPLLQLIARAITFVALRARSMAWSSLKTSGSGPPSSRDLSSLAWYTWSIGIT